MLRYRNVEEPRNDEVWEMIESGVGAADQYAVCAEGRHEFEWLPEVMEHLCYFCLYTQGDSESEDGDPEEPRIVVREESNGKKRKREDGSGSGEGKKKTGNRLA